MDIWTLKILGNFTTNSSIYISSGFFLYPEKLSKTVGSVYTNWTLLLISSYYTLS